MSSQVMRGDARSIPLADNTVDLVVTSPPYFGLRSYTDNGQHYAAQIGAEPTPAEFVDALLDVTRECVRVLKPTGSLWVNLGDKYAGNAAQRPQNGDLSKLKQSPQIGARYRGVRDKSLIGIPWRYALRCIDDLGLILRAEVIWSKPNGLPESVTDRVRRSHEQWFHFTLSPRYYSAVDEIREQYTAAPFRGQKTHRAGDSGATKNPVLASLTSWDASEYEHNPLGKLPSSVWDIPESESIVRSVLSAIHAGALTIDEGERILTQPSTPQRPTAPTGTSSTTQTPTSYPATEAECAECVCEQATGELTGGAKQADGPGSVWSVPTQPLTVPASLGVDHFAAFPFEFPRRIIRGWSPAEVCTACGEGRRPVVDRHKTVTSTYSTGKKRNHDPSQIGWADGQNVTQTATITGYACACPPCGHDDHGIDGGWLDPATSVWQECIAPTRPGVVLDPFGGTGTVALVADTLGRHGITLDASADYCRLAQWRTTDPGQRASAMQVDKPAAQLDGQEAFDFGAA